MLEIPESTTVGKQADDLLTGRKVFRVVPPTHEHKFTWFNSDAAGYPALLEGREVIGVTGHGAFVTLHFDRDTHLTIGDGTIMRYGDPHSTRPDKFQLLIEFDDASFLVFTVAMYGAIYAYKGAFDNPYYIGSLEKTSPLEEAFDRAYFEALEKSSKKKLTAKAFLATEQRIPGLGNGVLQDILFNARIHPKRKMETLSEKERDGLFDSVKGTIRQMTDAGGRDTEKNLYGEKGGYVTILSKNTWKEPCPVCGAAIVKEPYLGGAVYFCPVCQK